MTASARRPTLADVAQRAGTSTAVVSYVINDGPRQVAPATRARVQQAIHELGYRRNPIAGALSVGRSNLVGLLVPDTANGFFGELSRCFEGEGRRRGLMTLLGNTGYDVDVADGYVAAFSDLRPRAIFVTSIAPDGAQPLDTPVLFVHSSPEGASAPTVRFDDMGASLLAVEHLLAHGYDDIHCVSGPHVGDPASIRVEGWRNGMTRAGFTTEGRLHRSSFDPVSVEADMRTLLRAASPPRAILATTDEQALAVMRAAAAVGLRVPEDLAVVGIDGIREAMLGSVRLTTVRLPFEQLAARAFDLLEDLDSASTEHLMLPGSLAVGDTCGCPPA